MSDGPVEAVADIVLAHRDLGPLEDGDVEAPPRKAVKPFLDPVIPEEPARRSVLVIMVKPAALCAPPSVATTTSPILGMLRWSDLCKVSLIETPVSSGGSFSRVVV